MVAAAKIIGLAINAPTIARMVDRYGQARVMAPALAVSVSALVGVIVAATLQVPIWVVIALATVQGMSWGSPGALVRSRWMRILPSPGSLPTAYALESAIDEVVYIVGPILATVLGAVVHPALGLVLAATLLTVGAVAFLSQRSTEPLLSQSAANEVRPPSVLRNPVIIVLVLTYIGAGALFGANDVAVVAFAEEQKVPALSGVLLAIFAFGSLISALIYGARVWKQPLWKLYGIGIFTLAVGVSTFLLANSVLALGLIMVVTGLTIAPTLTNVNMIVTKVVSPGQLTEGLAWMTTALNIGVSAGSALAGPAVDARGSSGGFTVMVIAAWLMVAIMLTGLRYLKRGIVEYPRLPEQEQER